MNVVIRRVGPDEITRSAEVIRGAFSTVARDFHLTRENCPTHGAFLEAERLRASFENGGVGYGLFEEDEQVGFFMLTPAEDGGVYLEKVAVLPNKRHKGYGTMMLDYARAEALSLGAPVIYLSVNEFNARLKAWYQEYGFIPTGTRTFAHLPFPVGFMKYILREGIHEAMGRTV